MTLMPDTSNKLPAVYGKAFLSGMVTDAKISTDNQTMWYVIPLCESPSSGAITFGELYWGERKLTFSGTEAGRVVSFTNNSGQVDAKVDGNMWVYFYNNGSNSPTNGTTSTAISILSDANISAPARWDSTKLMTNTAFVIVKLIYSQDDGITGLDQLKVETINNQSGISDGYKPGSAMLDYLINDRYGANLDIEDVNPQSFYDLDAYADQLITYTPVGGGTATLPRYRFNGAVDTSLTVMTNLQMMADSCDSYIQYNEALGQWSVIANKAYDQFPNAVTTGQLFKFDDTNIIGGVNITPLDLNSTPNSVESKFRNGKSRGRDDYAYATTPDRLKSFNEPFNQMTIAYAYIDDSVRAQYLSNRKLEQARADFVVDITADYSAIQVDAGDVVTLTYQPHGGGGLSWTNKPFRVLQVQEERNDAGDLICKLQMSEYSSQVYDNWTIQDYTPPTDNYITDPTIISTPDAPTLLNILPSADVPSFQVSAVVPSSGVVYGMEFWYGPTIDIVNNNYILYDTQSSSSSSQYSAGDIETITVTGLVGGTYYWRVRAVGTQTKSLYSNSASLNWSPVVVAPSSAGTNYEWNPTALFCPSNSDGSVTTTGQYAELYLRVGAQIVPMWDKTGVQPAETWYVDTISQTAGLQTSAIAYNYVSNKVSFTITGLTVDQGTATLSDAYYKPVSGPNINLGTTSILVTKVKSGTTGATGSDGNKSVFVDMWQWSVTQPLPPTGSSTFNWATLENSLYTATDGWEVTPPLNPGTSNTVLWVATRGVTSASSAATENIDWTQSGTTVGAFTRNGSDGAIGYQSASPTVYQWALSTPSISGSSTYTWADGTVGTGYSSGWSTSIPTIPSPGFTLWEAKVSLNALATASTSTIDWTTSSILSSGYSGANGEASIIITMLRGEDVYATAADGTGAVFVNNEIRLYSGITLLTSGVVYAGGSVSNGVTATVNASTGVVSFSGTWTDNTASWVFTATYDGVTYDIGYRIAKSIAGQPAVLADLISETDVVPSDEAGNNYILPTGNGLRVYKGGVQITTGVVYAGTATKNNLTLTINASTGVITMSGNSWSTSTESFTVTATYDGQTYSAIYTLTKAKQGNVGNNGVRTAIMEMYKWSTTTPTTFPFDFTTYTWATGQFTMADSDGWSMVPAAGSPGQKLYVARKIYTDSLTTATTTLIWSSSVATVVGGYGSNGNNGESVYTADVFIQSATVPTAPTGGSYNFSTGALVAPASWSVTQPTTTTTPTYAVSYTFKTTTPATTVAGGTWTNVRVVAVSGSPGGAGDSGLSVFVGAIYKQQETAPTAPTGGTYNFSTNTQTAPSGWTVSQPASTTTPTWVAYYTFSTTTPSTDVAGGTYSTPIIDAQNGLSGARTAVLEMYKWSASAPTTFPEGDSTYTWATGEFTTPTTPNGWAVTTGVSTPGYNLYAVRVLLTNINTTLTDVVTWASPNTPYIIGYAGTDGTDGVGEQGASARRAYSRIPGSPSPVSGTITVSGDGRPTQAQSNTTWGLNYAWAATDPNTSSTSSLYQTDGIYNPATSQTVWDTPYLSSLRVGTLSAITTNTGNLNVNDKITVSNTGNIVGGQTAFDTGNGFFLGYSGSTYKFSIGNQNGSKITWDGTALNIQGDIKSNNAQVGNTTSAGYWLQQSTGDAHFSGNVYIGSNLVIAGVLSKGIINGNALPSSLNTTAPVGFTYSNPTNWTTLNAKADYPYSSAGALRNVGKLATVTYTPKTEYFDVGATFPKRLIRVSYNSTWSDPTNGTGPDLLVYLNGKTFGGTVPLGDTMNLQTQGPTAANPNGGWTLITRGTIIGRSLPSGGIQVTVEFIDTSPATRFFDGINYFTAVLVKSSASTGFTTLATNIVMTVQETY
jgi:hypothetical protein